MTVINSHILNSNYRKLIFEYTSFTSLTQGDALSLKLLTVGFERKCLTVIPEDL